MQHPTKEGTRVLAFSHATATEVFVFGEGVYVGQEVPPADSVGIAASFATWGVANPKIQLDNGEVVWGCECWWGPVDDVRAHLAGHVFVETSLAEWRTNAIRAEAESRDEEPS